jgi:hypothetical protein
VSDSGRRNAPSVSRSPRSDASVSHGSHAATSAHRYTFAGTDSFGVGSSAARTTRTPEMGAKPFAASTASASKSARSASSLSRRTCASTCCSCTTAGFSPLSSSSSSSGAEAPPRAQSASSASTPNSPPWNSACAGLW